jgi:acyl homoserine lactone synthase
MLQSYWPHLVADNNLPRSRDIWELTRLCIDRTMLPNLRTRITPELLCALHEYCTIKGINAVVGVTRPHLIKHFIRSDFSWLGEIDQIEGEEERAFRLPLASIRPEYHCKKQGLSGSLLSFDHLLPRRIAA